MLIAKKITKGDTAQLTEAARRFSESEGKGSVRASMRLFAQNDVYGVFDGESLVGWRVVSRKTGHVLSEMGVTSMGENGFEVFKAAGDELAAQNERTAEKERLRIENPGAVYTELPDPVQKPSAIDVAPAGKELSGAESDTDGADAGAIGGADDFGSRLLENATFVLNDPFFEGTTRPRTSKAKAATIMASDPFEELDDESLRVQEENAALLAQDVSDADAAYYASATTAGTGAVDISSDDTEPAPKLAFGKKVLGTAMTLLLLIGAIFAVYVSWQQMQEQQAAQATQESAEEEIDWNLYERVPDGELVHVQVMSGMAPRDIAVLLAENGLVSAAMSFLDEVEAQGTAESLQAGDYIIPWDEDASSVVSRMATGDRVPDGVIGVNTGDTVSAVADAVGAAGLSFGREEVMTELSDVEKWRGMSSMLADVPQGLPTLEGYLASGEYDLRRVDSAEETLSILLAPMQERFIESGMTSSDFHAMLTKASLIEKEALFDEDRANISSVIDNRLAADAFLQIDAAVKYANNYDGARVYDSQLQIDSPYNTYMYKGLPIGPICSGIAQVDIDAAQNPEQTDYFYYVLQDTEGHHRFCVTAEEFEEAKNEYLKAFGYED